MSLFMQYRLAQTLGDLGAGGGVAVGDGGGWAGAGGAAAGFGFGMGVMMPYLILRSMGSRGWPPPAPMSAAPHPRFCGMCGAPYVAGARYCGHCGTAATR